MTRPWLALILFAFANLGSVAVAQTADPHSTVFYVITDSAGKSVVLPVPTVSKPCPTRILTAPPTTTGSRPCPTAPTSTTAPVPQQTTLRPSRPRPEWLPTAAEPSARTIQPVACTVPPPPPGPIRFGFYGHAGDYRYLQGELRYLHGRRTWQLRYAPVDEEDCYGGSVTLTGAGSMTRFANGDFVRVEGYLLDPQSRRAAPDYAVQTIRHLTQP